MIWLMLSTAILCFACVFVMLVLIWIKLGTIERMIAMEQSATRIPPGSRAAGIPQPFRAEYRGPLVKGQTVAEMVDGVRAMQQRIRDWS